MKERGKGGGKGHIYGGEEEEGDKEAKGKGGHLLGIIPRPCMLHRIPVPYFLQEA